MTYVGGGVELPSHYPQWKLEYLKIETPAALQSSLNKLVEGTCIENLITVSRSTAVLIFTFSLYQKLAEILLWRPVLAGLVA